MKNRSIVFFSFVFLLLPIFAQNKKSLAYLDKGGSGQVLGLPYIKSNSLKCISGSYLLEYKEELILWYSKDKIAKENTWKTVLIQNKTGFYIFFYLNKGKIKTILAYQNKDYSLFFEVLQRNKELDLFVNNFIYRFNTIFYNAKTDADISFPAFIQY